MQAGTIAAILAFVGTVLVAAIGYAGARAGGILTRRTELEKMYMERLRVSEQRVNDLLNEIQELRQENIKGLIAQEKLSQFMYEHKRVSKHEEEYEETGET